MDKTNEQIIEDLTRGLNEDAADLPCDFESDPVVEPARVDSDGPTLEKPGEDDVDDAYLMDRDKDLSSKAKEAFRVESKKLKEKGNEKFNGKAYAEAVIAYTEALQILPLAYGKERAVLFSNRSAAKFKQGKNETALKDCTKALELDEAYVKAYMRRAILYERLDKLDEALEDYKKILELDPGNKEVTAATIKLPPLIREKNEKLKAEMLGKLKDLGNLVLKPFGLSTDNFKMTPNESGGYSVNFQQKG